MTQTADSMFHCMSWLKKEQLLRYRENQEINTGKSKQH